MRLAWCVSLIFAGAAAAADCNPLETRDPDGKGQTRACGVKSSVAFDVTVVATGLSHPWAVEPLPNGSLLVTERPGRMRIVSAGGRVHEPLEGLPPVDARGQGGSSTWR